MFCRPPPTQSRLKVVSTALAQGTLISAHSEAFSELGLWNLRLF